MLDLILADSPKSDADDLMWLATRKDPISADYVRTALAHGANPNGIVRQTCYPPPAAPPGTKYPCVLPETMLGVSARSPYETSEEIIRLLLQAGADVNFLSHDERPLWLAADDLIALSHERIDASDARWRRARAIFLMLAKAGADPGPPDARGRPPVWGRIFPGYGRKDNYIPADLLCFFAAHGMDINAPLQGERVLAAVEKKAGRDSATAKALRACGAK